ncbi:hypothetical protein A4A29_08315 [Staphylococcus equorum]|uniref:hypothetical protein n=1 Tax=Staphylococcus equorum TaxID=246432 RepID=UPI0008FB6623|nr:hypothetical protein [Staphylococcus equorum]OIS53137.1 hypothetical protein A4A29_08315 [Staphylococcus equorum]
MNKNEEFRTSDKLATLSLFGLGTFTDIRGFYWLLNQESVLDESEFYQALHNVMPIWLWGLLLMVFGTSLMIASIFFGKRSLNNMTYYFMLIGGTGSAIIHFLMASAGIYNSINWLSPIQFVVLTAWLGFVGFLGGLKLYDK